MDQLQPGLRVRRGMNLQATLRQNEVHKLQIFRIVVDGHQPHGRRISAACAHDHLAAAINESSTRLISSSRVNGLRRIAVPSSSTPCVAISPSAYPDMYSTPMPGRSASMM